MYLLDCTLRDGGYYNNWSFSKKLVKDYLKTISLTGIDIVELAFRFKNKAKYGDYGHLTEKKITNLNLPENLRYSLMINCKDFISNSKIDLNLINKFFVDKKKSKISIIRIAANYSELDKAISIANELYKKKYNVFLNIMQITTLKKRELIDISKKIKKQKNISVFYIADSLGDLTINKLREIHKIIKKTKKPLGIHAHDNLNLALSNTLFAKKLGFKYFDSTILGMGRGAGNTKTEELTYEINEQNNISKYNYQIIYNLILEFFKKMKKKYEWGSNTYYYLSAKNQIHPTYIQKMIDDEKYSEKDILSTLNLLKELNSRKYDINLLNDAIYNLPNSNVNGDWYPKKDLENKNILILGPGKTVLKYKKKIINYIKQHKAKVICLNFNNFINKKYLSYYCTCNIGRFVMEVHKYVNSNIPLIFPKKLISEQNIFFKKLNILNYGVNFIKLKFDISKNMCVLPDNLSLFYALAVGISAGSNEIALAGLDGYTKDDNKFKNVQKNLMYLNKYKKKIKFITPSLYKI